MGVISPSTSSHPHTALQPSARLPAARPARPPGPSAASEFSKNIAADATVGGGKVDGPQARFRGSKIAKKNGARSKSGRRAGLYRGQRRRRWAGVRWMDPRYDLVGVRPLPARCGALQFQIGQNGAHSGSGRRAGCIGVGGVDGWRGRGGWTPDLISGVCARSPRAPAPKSQKNGALEKRAASGAVAGSAASTVGGGEVDGLRARSRWCAPAPRAPQRAPVPNWSKRGALEKRAASGAVAGSAASTVGGGEVDGPPVRWQACAPAPAILEPRALHI
ncbi:hypothetical protein B0H13DRAFT_1853708 [Mycena leptocephala]|nr:hypothetical protein B0H13DRAFT_1853708 [Mycena leptocephala]